jgi:hypothetical protein
MESISYKPQALSPTDRPRHLTFDVTRNGHRSHTARCRQLDIAAQGNSFEDLYANVRQAVRRYFSQESTDGAIELVVKNNPCPDPKAQRGR